MRPWMPINPNPRTELPTKPTPTQLHRGRMRRRVEDHTEARALGADLAELCLGCGGRTVGGADLCYRCRDQGQLILL